MIRLIFEGLDFTGKSSAIAGLQKRLKHTRTQVLQFPKMADPAIVSAAMHGHEKNKFSLMLLSTYYGIKDHKEPCDYQLIDRSFLSAFAYNCNSRHDIYDGMNTLRKVYDQDDSSIVFNHLFYFYADLDTLKERAEKRYQSKKESDIDDYRRKLDGEVIKNYPHYLERYDIALEDYEKTFKDTRPLITRINTGKGGMREDEVVDFIMSCRVTR